MNIIVFTYRAQISGGSNRSLLSILDILIQRGHNVTLYLPEKTGEMYEVAEKLGVNCSFMPFHNIIDERCEGFELIRRYKRLYKLYVKEHICAYKLSKEVRKLEPDIVYTNGAFVHMGRLMAKILKKPHVIHIREFFPEYGIVPFFRYNLLSRGTSKFILISSDLYNEYKKHVCEKKLIMISNGIKYVEQPLKIPHDGFNLLITARICDDKRQMDAIEALNIIYKHDNVNDIFLNIAGTAGRPMDIIYKKSLEQKIHQYNLDTKVMFLGEVKDMSSVRQKMDVELICSSREPFGRVTVEAMRSGLGVIASNAGGTKDIVKDDYNGLVYSPGNILELRNKIMLFYRNRHILDRISSNGKLFSRDNFTEKQLYKIVDLLENVANNN